MASHDYPTDFPIGAPLTDAETPRAFLPGATTPSARQLPPAGLPLQAGRGPFLENDMPITVTTNIHGVTLAPRRPVDFDNANAVPLRFQSAEGWKGGSHELTIFSLDAATAECLYLIAAMTPEQRAEMLPALRHGLDVDLAEAQIEIEEAVA